jgi:excisionase family DNA binding protein
MSNAFPEPIAYSVADACRAIGIKKTKLYSLLKDGQLQARRIGGRTLIPATSLRRLIEGAAD